MPKDPKIWCSCTKCISQYRSASYPFLDHHMSVCYLLKLFKSPIYYDTYDEHIRCLQEFLEISSNGLFVNDLLHVSRILQLILEELDSAPFLEPYLGKLLDVCELPLILFDHSEELSGVFYIAEYMSLLGLLVIWMENKEFRQTVYKSLFNLLTRKETQTNHASLALRFKSIEFSYISEIITQITASTFFEELLDILVIFYALTEVSAFVSQNMAKVNAMDYILLRLLPKLDENSDDDEDKERPKPDRNYFNLVNLSFEILLNIVRSLEGLDKNELKEITPSRESLGIIQYILREVMIDNNKYIRNNIVEYILLCLEFFPIIPFADSYLADDLATLCVATELNCKDTWLEDVKFSYDASGIAFKKLLLLCLCYINKYPTLHLIYENQCVIPGLLKMLAPNFRAPWHQDENIAIMKTVFIGLYHIVPRLIKTFLENKGNAMLLILIEIYIFAPIQCNYINMEGSLKLLDRIMEDKNPALLEDFRVHCGVEVITMLVNTILQKDAILSTDQQYLSYCFCILEHFIDNKLDENETPISLVIKYLTRVLNPHLNDIILDPRSVICALDFLWQSLLVNHDNLKSFLKLEGIYILLDIIQMCPFSVQVIGLGCLVDICVEDSCIPFIMTWRGGEKKELNIYSFLASIFYRECKKIGTSLDSNGVITDTCFPLMAKQQILDIFEPTLNKKSYRAVLDLQGSTRPKIYAILQIIKTNHEDKVKLTNEYFKVTNLPMSKKHKVILHLAESFLALKIGETWKELVLKLSTTDTTPIDIDGQMLAFIVDKMQKWNENVKEEQEHIVNLEVEKDVIEEYKVYNLMKECRKKEMIDAKRDMIYFAKTSNRMFMLAEKRRENKEIGKYQKTPDEVNCTMHSTYMDHVNFTNVFHLKYKVAFNVCHKNT